jgi:hypothetical protein
VIATLACPRCSWMNLGWTFFWNRSEAQVWRRSWKVMGGDPRASGAQPPAEERGLSRPRADSRGCRVLLLSSTAVRSAVGPQCHGHTSARGGEDGLAKRSRSDKQAAIPPRQPAHRSRTTARALAHRRGQLSPRARQQADGHHRATDQPESGQAARPSIRSPGKVVQHQQPQAYQGMAEEVHKARQEPTRDVEDDECRADGDYERAN